jgi:integrase
MRRFRMSYLQEWTNGVWRVRLPIPRPLQPIFGKARLIESLGTKNETEAKRLAIPVLAKFQDMIQLAEDGAWPPPDEATIDQIASGWAKWASQANIFAVYGRSLAFQTEHEFHSSLLQYIVGSGTGIRVHNASVVNRISRRAELHCQILDRQRQASIEPTEVPSLTVNGSARIYPFPNLIDLWAKESRNDNPKTRDKFTRIVNSLTEFLKHEDAARPTAENIEAWLKHLQETPGRRGMRGDRTIEDHRTVIATLYNVAVAKQRVTGITINPVCGIAFKPKPQERPRRGFRDEEARKILTAARNETEPHKRWVPWLANFTGARLDEICGATANAVEQIDGIWVINYDSKHREHGLPVKSQERLVPLHPKLIEQGFLEYVERLPKNGPLFPNLGPDAYGRRAGTATKRLGRWIRKEVEITDAKIGPNHSFRHRFKTLCRRGGIPKEIHHYLTGHFLKDVGDEYGEYEPKRLFEEISKIESPV